MKKKAEPISEVLKNVFSSLESQRNPAREEVDELWRALVGEGGFRHARPATLKKGILTVRVDSSGWMQELALRKRELLKGLKRTLGKDRISEIHFKIGEF